MVDESNGALKRTKPTSPCFGSEVGFLFRRCYRPLATSIPSYEQVQRSLVMVLFIYADLYAYFLKPYQSVAFKFARPD